jgi:hypothetical protein
MKINKLLIAMLVLSLSFIAAACGDDDDDGTAQPDASAQTDAAGDAAAAADSATAGSSVQVKMGSQTATVDMTGLPTAKINGTDVVLVSAIIEQSGLSVDYAKATLDFEGSDGFRPSTKENCSSFLPTAASNADMIGVNLADNDTLVWDDSLSAPGCAGVKDVAIIYIMATGEIDASIPDSGSPDAAEPADDAGSADNEVTVKYGSDEKEVALGSVATVEIDGTAVVLVSDIIEESGFDVDLNYVTIDFEGSDGFRPSTKPNCSSFLPTKGINAERVGVNLADENTLLWQGVLNAPGCAAVKDVAVIYLEDV